MIIDAENLVVGRLASYVAKKALLGEKIDIINCEKAVISGSRKEILLKYNIKKKEGSTARGPFFPRNSDRLVRRIIRGMLPYKQEKGAKAFDKVMCYTGVPKELEGKKAETISMANINNRKTMKFITVLDLCKELGRS